MRIGLVADIHGNISALKEVLKDAGKIDRWICAGDVVGYYPYCNEVCELIQKIDAYVVRGNHDAFVTGELVPDHNNREVYRTDWIVKHLQAQHQNWLKSLPVEMCFCWGEKILRVRHASPWDETTYLYPDSAQLKNVHLEKEEVLLLGHTHHPMFVSCEKGFVVNPGSVGQPRDGDSRAAYMTMDTSDGRVTQHRVVYDVKGFQCQLKKLGWNPETIDILSRTTS